MLRKIGAIALVSLGIALGGCSATKVSGTLKGKETQDLSLLALLPVRIDGDITRERAIEVHRKVESELRARGYLLIDGSLVLRVCKTPECPNRAELFTDFGAKALTLNAVNSVARTNFLAGYVNSVSGSLSFINAHGEELLSVKHAKRERGGLLFNTGQLAEGLIQTARNSNSQESFSGLAERYAKELVDELPHPSPQAQAQTQPMAAAISDAAITEAAGGAHTVCLRGTPSSLASLVYRKTRSTLREVKPGEYCGVFHLADFPQPEALEVELRSPYGDAARRPLKATPRQLCVWSDDTQLTERANKVRIEARCGVLRQYRKVMVYRAPGQFGVFEKVGELTRGAWTGPSVSGAVYAIVAVSPSGEFYPPALVGQKQGA